MTSFISDQLHTLHRDKSKTKTTEGIYLKSSITVHVFSPALENQTCKNIQLLCAALGLTNLCFKQHQRNDVTRTASPRWHVGAERGAPCTQFYRFNYLVILEIGFKKHKTGPFIKV